jgi:hypothetical protein
VVGWVDGWLGKRTNERVIEAIDWINLTKVIANQVAIVTAESW